MAVNVSLTSVRQGDVYIRGYAEGDAYITGVDRRFKKMIRAGKQVTLALGEQTGHSHVLESTDEVLMYTDPENGRMYLRIGEAGARVVHQEHGTVTLPAGQYVATVQQEYDPATEKRAVWD